MAEQEGMSITKVELSYSGISEVLKSPEMQAMLRSMGEAVKEAADAHHVLVRRGSDRQPVPNIHVDVSVAGDRARCYVSIDDPAGLNIEAKYGTLTACIDAARGGLS